MTGRRILITGAAQRLGATMAQSLAADGWEVVIHCNRSLAAGEKLVAAILADGGKAGVIRADLSKKADIESLIPSVLEKFGALDALINNASRFVRDDSATVTWDSLHAHLLPNLVAPVLLNRDFAAAYTGKDGNIINMIDQKVMALNPDFLSYTLSKVGLAGLTRMQAMAFAGRIRVNGIAPGVTLISGKQTPESFAAAWSATPTGRSSTPAEIAACVQFILATPSLTGQTIVLDGGESMVRRPRDVAFETEPRA